jgi:beta-lactam-binding protein with PASTA domain/predicted Ser/Thr protein kinase
LIGRVFDDRYEVVRKLGSGGFADVYLANDRLLGRQVALKVLSSRYAHDEQFVERFRREASSAAGLNHPNIVQIYDRGEAEGTYYIAMEYLEGRSLKEVIVKYAPLSSELLVSVAVQILEALRFAHRRDVIHRDIKPQNIIIDNDGRVKVTDFGIARAGSASTMTEAGSILGTAHYFSPEQAQGQPVEAASDLYSLGVVMYEMATGGLPFDGENPVSIAMKHVHDPPAAPRSINPLIPENLEAVILRSLGKRPVDRYLTAQAMLDDLKRVQEGQPVVAPTGFAEEVTRVMAPVAAAGAAGMAQPTQVRRRPPDLPAPIIEPDEEPGRPRSAWPWVLVIILILALAGAAYVILSNWDTGQVELGTVPGVVGLSEAEAMVKVKAAGFNYEKEGVQPSADVAQGDVARQDPQENSKLEKGKVIGVWISSGTGQVDVPNVVGLSEAQAAAKIGAAGLEVASKPEVNPDQPVGTVLRQNPEANKKVDAGTIVTITVAAATNTVKVPLLTGMNQTAAVASLNSMTLVATVEAIDSQLPGGTVVDQDPKAGVEVQPNSTVKVFVSNAPAPTTVKVPAVAALGLSEAQAKAKLALYGLKAKVINLETPDFKPGLCIYQDPAAGVEVKIGSVVQITIARVPVTTTTTTAPPTTTTTAPPTTTTVAPPVT